MTWFTEDNETRKKKWPIWDYMFKYFPLAWLEEVRVSVIGNEQHNPGEPLHWAREKSTDQLNTAFRHLFDYAEAKARGVVVPRDSKGNAVLAQVRWRIGAQLQLDLEEEARQQASVPVPSPCPDDSVEVTCQCGAKIFFSHPGDLEPNLTDRSGVFHSPSSCHAPS